MMQLVYIWDVGNKIGTFSIKNCHENEKKL